MSLLTNCDRTLTIDAAEDQGVAMRAFQLEELEKSKLQMDFDSLVATIIAERLTQASSISVAALTAQIKLRFNQAKMRELAGTPATSLQPTVGGGRRFLRYKSHDQLLAITRGVVKYYYQLTGQANPTRKQVRDGAAQVQVVLSEAVRAIPLRDVKGSR